MNIYSEMELEELIVKYLEENNIRTNIVIQIKDKKVKITQGTIPKEGVTLWQKP